MISFLKQFVRQHLILLLCAIFIAVCWPQLRRNLFFIKDLGDSTTNPLPTNNIIDNAMRIFTPDELKLYNGIDKPELYLSLLGNVYDVTKGEKHYGKDGSYHYFVGRDASVAFITGDFDIDAPEQRDDTDILGRLKAQEIYSLKQWQDFYDKTYTFMGRLAGNMYDHSGHTTDYYKKVMAEVDVAISENQREEWLREQYPPCNIEWKETTGTRVWCSKQSGGIDRAWPGYPRKYFQVGKTDYRCACVPDDRLEDAALREYDDCDAKETTCFYNV